MESTKDLATALSAFQAELVSVGKTADNPFFKSKYADLGSIMKQAQPILTKHGLSVMQLPDNIEGNPALTTIVMHKSGEQVRATVPLVLSKNDPQGFGSAMTYFRRYGYAAALQIVIDEDDDGQKASNNKPSNLKVDVDQALQGEATDKQKDTINKELEKLGIVQEERKGYMIEQYGAEFPLNKEMASFIIGDLF